MHIQLYGPTFFSIFKSVMLELKKKIDYKGKLPLVDSIFL